MKGYTVVLSCKNDVVNYGESFNISSDLHEDMDDALDDIFYELIEFLKSIDVDKNRYDIHKYRKLFYESDNKYATFRKIHKETCGGKYVYTVWYFTLYEYTLPDAGTFPLREFTGIDCDLFKKICKNPKITMEEDTFGHHLQWSLSDTCRESKHYNVRTPKVDILSPGLTNFIYEFI